MNRSGTSFLSLVSLALSSCAPEAPTPSPALPAPQGPARQPSLAPPVEISERVKFPAPEKVAVQKVTPPAPVPKVTRHKLASRTASADGIVLTVVTFDRRDFDLEVADQDGLAAQWSTAAEAGAGSLAAINGGFFTPEGKPLGLVISKGDRAGSINRASSLGAGVFIGGNERLISRKAYLASKPKALNLLQTGPRLVWNSRRIPGLQQGNDRPRSFLLWDGAEHFGIGYANSATLSSLASALSKQPLPGFKIHHALNLDGGRSSDLWVSPSVNGGGLTRRSWLNKEVRNYLVLKPE